MREVQEGERVFPGFAARVRAAGPHAEVREVRLRWVQRQTILGRTLAQDLPDTLGIVAVLERTHSWMNRFRCIPTRWEKKTENYL